LLLSGFYRGDWATKGDVVMSVFPSTSHSIMLSDRLSRSCKTTHTGEFVVRSATAVLVALLGTLLPASGAIEWLALCEASAPAEETVESTEAALANRTVIQLSAKVARAHDAPVTPGPSVGHCRPTRTVCGSGHRLANNLMAPMLC
jgi:hypothetical protein